VETDSICLTQSRIWNDSYLSVDNILITDSVVWIFTDQSDGHILHACNLSGQMVAEGLEYGNGPDEVLELSSIHPLKGDNIAVYDSRKGRIFSVTGDGPHLRLSTLRDSLRMLDDALLLTEHSVLALPLNTAVSYVILGADNVTVDSLSHFPPKPDGIDNRVHILACTGMIAYSDRSKRFVRSIAYDGGLDFFDISDSKLKFVKRHSVFDMAYGVMRSSVDLPVPDENSRVGYSNVYATQGYFYASFSDSKALDNPSGLSNEIHMFDHDGNIIKRIILDKKVGPFAVTPDDSRLFVSSENDDKTLICTYELDNSM